ncbi:MAG: ADP-ribosyl-[dinitrogen reductase] hydrolase, partial [Solirubrobacteraceae bacterium]|nr:ADP-ribosyl-[dinitrogen reductase] hydrolase [Solirubrobacteraceae bacterium]
DPADQLRRYVRWYRQGYWSSTGVCFDIGNATRAALERFERTGESFPGDAAPDAAGNGPLMKLAPIPMAFASAPADAVVHAADAARTTHGAPEAADAASAFAAQRVTELAGVALAPPGVWSEAAEALHTPRTNGVRGALASRREPPEIRGTGYVVDALEAALWAVRTTSSFAAAILAAVNLGDDADTTAAIAGQLAGARYGAGAIPAGWLEQLVMRDAIIDVAGRLWRFGSVGGDGRP